MWLISMAGGFNGPSKLSSPVLGVPGVTGVQNTSQSHSTREKCPGYVPACCEKLLRLNLICAWRRLQQQFLSWTEEVISVGGKVHPFNILTLGWDVWKHHSVKKGKVTPLYFKRGGGLVWVWLPSLSLPLKDWRFVQHQSQEGLSVPAGHWGNFHA